jgi:hypothetical protein
MMNECTRSHSKSGACCGKSLLAPSTSTPSTSKVPPTSNCCDEGFNLVPSEKCSGKQAIYVDECTRAQPGKVCCGASYVEAPKKDNAGLKSTRHPGGDSDGAECCDQEFKNLNSENKYLNSATN